MTTTHNSTSNHSNHSNHILTTAVTCAALLLGTACGASTDSTSPIPTPPANAEVIELTPSTSVDQSLDAVDLDQTPVPVAPPTTVDQPVAEASSEPEPAPEPIPEPAAEPEPEPAPEPIPAPEPAPIPEPEPEPDPQPAPPPVDDVVAPSDDDATWDGACGPNDPMPAGAEFISATTVQFGDGVENTATAYLYEDVWKLRIDGPVVSDEMILDAPTNGLVQVLTTAPVSSFGGDEILVKLDSIADLRMVGIFGQHDGCLFRHTTTAAEPVTLTVGIHDGAMFGITCHTDDFGSFVTSRSAVLNDDETWNTYGTSYTYDAPTMLQAGDGGHEVAIPADHPVLGTFANIECGDLELGQF